MKTIHYLSIIILLFSSQILLAQNDTLVGVLRDISDKIIKRYPVTLGSQSPGQRIQLYNHYFRE